MITQGCKHPFKRCFLTMINMQSFGCNIIMAWFSQRTKSTLAAGQRGDWATTCTPGRVDAESFTKTLSLMNTKDDKWLWIIGKFTGKPYFLMVKTMVSGYIRFSLKPNPLINGYGSIPINTIFRGMNIHKSQLFWCEQKGYYWFWHTAKSLYQFNDWGLFRFPGLVAIQHDTGIGEYKPL